MKRLAIILSALFNLFVFVPGAFATADGSCVFTPGPTASNGSLELVWVCTSGSDGGVYAPTLTGATNYPIAGTAVRMEIIPGTGRNQPTTGFALTLNPISSGTTPDTTSDFLHGFGASCSNSSSTIKDVQSGYVAPIPNRMLVPTASGVGNAKTFTLKVWVTPGTASPASGSPGFVRRASCSGFNTAGQFCLDANGLEWYYSGSSLVQVPTTGTLILPSGDTSGATDTANLGAATGKVYLTAGRYYTDKTLFINNTNHLFLNGPLSGATINVLGNGPGIEVVTSGAMTSGWGLENIHINTATNTTGGALKLDTAWAGYVKNLTILVQGSSQYGLCVTGTPQVAGIGSSYNTLENTFITLTEGAAGATAVQFTGVSTAGNSHNVFINLTVALGAASQTGLWLQVGDTNTFTQYACYGNTDIAATAINFDYSVATQWPGDNYIYGLDDGYNISSGSSAIINTGIPGGGATPNVIFGLRLGDSETIPNLANLQVIGTVGQFQGTKAADNARAGIVGEYLSNSAGSVGMTNATPTNATSIALSPGDWDVQCTAMFNSGSGTAATGIEATLSTISGASGSLPQYGGVLNATFSTGVTYNCVITPTVRFNVSTGTTVYCVADSWFSGGTLTVSAFMRARRVR